MVTIFAYKQVLDYLLEHGFVVTFRDHPLKDNNGNDIFRKGFGWITNRRGGKKIADVEIIWQNDYHNVGLSKEENTLDWKKVLGEYIEESSFKTVDEWIEVIKKLNKGKIPARGYLYRVEILKLYVEPKAILVITFDI